MSKNVKILFAADIHLGIVPEKAIIDEETHFGTFKKIVGLAEDHDILLIAGDLFDSPRISKDLIDNISQEFKNLTSKGVDVIFTPGPGDINPNGVIPDHIYSLNCTTVFANPVYSPPHIFTKEDQKVYIYGLPSSGGSDISKIKKESESGFHIGLFHMDFNPRNKEQDSPVYALQKDDIKSLDLDFYALGHSHSFRMFKVNGKIIGAFPGTPESLSTLECGDRYVISMCISDNEIEQIKRLSVNNINVIKEEVNCSNESNPEAIYDILRLKKSKKNYLHISMNGERSFAFEQKIFSNYINDFYSLIIDDNSVVTLDSLIDEFRNENSLRGLFFNKLEEKLKTESFKKDEITILNNSMDRIRKDGFISLEDWLCTTSQS